MMAVEVSRRTLLKVELLQREVPLDRLEQMEMPEESLNPALRERALDAIALLESLEMK